MRHTHYWMEGGRGSLKSSTAGVEIPLGIMRDPNANAVVLRKVRDTLKDSVFEQLEWAIEMLQVSHLWISKVSPLSLTYKPTGQQILFRGADKPKRIKSLKFRKGYCRYIWYEELDEFGGTRMRFESSINLSCVEDQCLPCSTHTILPRAQIAG